MCRPLTFVRRADRPPSMCIVNDAYVGGRGICGGVAARHRRCRQPVCANHLCQYRGSNGHRCRKTPRRLLLGTVDKRAGWFPDPRAAVYCEDHENYNCLGFVDRAGAMRCPGTKAPGRHYCAAHAAALCKWTTDDGRPCAAEPRQESEYCREHCCVIWSTPGIRCRERRSRSGYFCAFHQCLWRDKHARCECTSFPNSPGVCDRHICAARGCRRAALDDSSCCAEHGHAFRDAFRPRRQADWTP